MPKASVEQAGKPPLNISVDVPLTKMLCEGREKIGSFPIRCEVAHKHFFKKILKVLQRPPLKNTSGQKQAPQATNRTLDRSIKLNCPLEN
jgi:hypothetical protein